jgi:ABC-2 type transport system permease protein
MNATAPFPPPRVQPHAGHALAGLWRLAARRFYTPGYWLTLAGMLVALVVLSLPVTQAKTAAQAGLLPWAAGFYVCFVVPLLSFIAAAGTLRDDFGGATVDYILTRPLRRPVFVAFRYLTQMVATQISFLFGFATIVGLCAFWEVPDFVGALPLLLLGQVCAVMTFSAVGFLCGAITSRYVIVGVAYGAIVEVGLGNVPTQLNQISIIRHVLALVQPLLGEGRWAISQTLGTATSSSGIPTVVLLAGISAAAVALTAVLFAWKEFAGSAARDA